MLTAEITVRDESGVVVSNATIECERYQEERRKGPLRYIVTLFVGEPAAKETEVVQGGTQ